MNLMGKIKEISGFHFLNNAKMKASGLSQSQVSSDRRLIFLWQVVSGS